MPAVRFQISMSLDGFVAGANQSVENPIGEGGMALHEWVFALRSWRQSHGQEGGEDGVSNAVVDRMTQNVGATIMGRNMFGGSGDWVANPWDGWWGDEPPFHHPVFVLTHHPREPLELTGTTFHFVTDGIESALAQARAAVGEQDVAIAGGASTVQQYLAAGLVDELTLHLVPILLHDGERLFDNLAATQLNLECTEAIAAPGVTHITYRARR